MGGDFDWDNLLDSTELLVHGANSWTSSGSLPTPRYQIAGATLNNKIIITGYVPGNAIHYILLLNKFPFLSFTM